MLRSFALSIKGDAHAELEDAFFASDERGLYVVSDGVGRFKGAATASRLAVDATVAALAGDRPADAEAARRWLSGAHRAAAKRLSAEGRRDRVLSSMSATLTLALVRDRVAWLAHVGDSRAHRLRGGHLEQLTRDHSVAFEQFEAGAITKDALRTHPNQKLLTRTLSASRDFVLPELALVALEPGDLLLLCTDGLTKALDDAAIEALVREGGEPEALTRRLIDASTREDDTTVIVVALA